MVFLPSVFLPIIGTKPLSRNRKQKNGTVSKVVFCKGKDELDKLYKNVIVLLFEPQNFLL